MAGGCAGSVEYVQVTTPPRTLFARAPERVDLFLVTPPARPHTDVGLLQAIPAANGDSLQDLSLLLRGAAAARGCDAVLVTMIDVRYTNKTPQTVQGSCEVYTDISSPELPAPAPKPAPREQPAAASKPRAAVVVSGSAEVHSAPSSVAPVIARLDSGTAITVVSTNPGWSFTKLPDGRGGYLTDASVVPR
jgi:hypothetical protein